MATEYDESIILFGASGDLAKRKLYPSLFKLFLRGNLKNHFAIIGVSRTNWSDSEYQKIIKDILIRNENIINNKLFKFDLLDEFVKHCSYCPLDLTNHHNYINLKRKIQSKEKVFNIPSKRIFYLSIAPNLFSTVSNYLKSEQLLSNTGQNKLVIEKPFGTDYKSATHLNDQLNEVFNENEIYRIDHYLGKEMVHNIQAVRFSNTIIESLWNNHYIDNIQITLSEKIGIENRANYYDKAGALRDMVQSHILQIAAQLAMDQPVTFSDEDIRVEKVKALHALRIYKDYEVNKYFVRGQYAANNGCKAYRDEKNIPANSNTNTFVAGKLLFDNNRWLGVPFYIRTGKRLNDKFTRIDVTFKKPLIDLFNFTSNNYTHQNFLNPNILTIFVEPKYGFSLTLNTMTVKQEMNMKLSPINLNFYQDTITSNKFPDAYERLIHDILKGDQTNFASWKEISYSWKFIDVIQKYWDKKEPIFPNYIPGSMGPASADELLKQDNRKWVYRIN
ncbi:MAG: glucose-6-phosphate dehydrogenase [Firmicutes bacterium]|uniref:Glucose-6-phosphate 1-dehydrogenase n=1 Tax=Candidatus Gallilactobacillus intestinavium TaxID=2840838 RepID=A0A9D9E5L2_9LACO|nr:glucose-6-phosphate dehydrogenase [Candidatus Gallilactobacillus intestinavium]